LGIRLHDESRLQVAGESLPYRLRDDFLSAAELSFYHVLKSVVKDRAVVLAKVNLADIFFVAKPNENQSYRNKIDRKHVDFLCCDPSTMTPLVGIELNDSSHYRSDRVERDQFVTQVFEVAGLPLVPIPAKRGYDPNQLAVQLAPHLNVSEVAPIVPVVAAPQSPVCPKCGIPMVSRTAAKGKNAGNQFWGCSNYPRCKEVVGG